MNENRFEIRFSEMNEELIAIMKLAKELYGIPQLTTCELHWYDNPDNLNRLSDKAATISAMFHRMSELLYEMADEITDSNEELPNSWEM